MKSPKSLNELFDNNRHQSNLVQYQQKTKDFRVIKSLLSDHLDDNIAQNIIVSNFKNSILYLETSSPAIATAFKMVQSRILSQVRREINPGTVTIEMKVSPKSTLVGASKGHNQAAAIPGSKSAENKSVNDGSLTPFSSKSLPDSVVSSIESIADNSDGKLKQALLRLAKHRSPK